MATLSEVSKAKEVTKAAKMAKTTKADSKEVTKAAISKEVRKAQASKGIVRGIITRVGREVTKVSAINAGWLGRRRPNAPRV